jgi:formylglycine-generating enzyme required for sulfatase activity
MRISGRVWWPAICIFIALPAGQARAVPNSIAYSGNLTDGSGKPYSGEVSIVAGLFGQAEGGAALTECTFDGVEVQDGALTFVLGQQPECVPLLTFETVDVPELWLEVTVCDTPQSGCVALTPRQRVLSVPYALECDNAGKLAGTPASEFVTGSELQDAGFLVSADVQETCLASSGAEVALHKDLDALEKSAVCHEDLAGLLMDYCEAPCYGDADVQDLLAQAGYLPGPYYSDAAVETILAGKQYCAAPCAPDLSGDVAALQSQLYDLQAQVSEFQAALWCHEICDAVSIGDCRKRTCDGTAKECKEAGPSPDGTPCDGGLGSCVQGECDHPLVCGGVQCPVFGVGYAVTCNTRQHCEYANKDTTGWRSRDVWIYVPAGSFWMGSEGEDGLADEAPVHHVTLTKGFFIMKYEATVEQYHGCFLDGDCPDLGEEFVWDGDGWEYNWADLAAKAPKHYRPGHPQNGLSWDEAAGFCDWFGEARLPTEAEWEYAASGPVHTRYPWGNGPSPICSLGVVAFNEAGSKIKPWSCNPCLEVGCSGTLEVGSYPAGASWCGALDMAGNVWEWCEDWYSAEYYEEGPKVDPHGPDSGWFRVRRGGCFNASTKLLRVAARHNAPADSRIAGFGARCVKTAK